MKLLSKLKKYFSVEKQSFSERKNVYAVERPQGDVEVRYGLCTKV